MPKGVPVITKKGGRSDIQIVTLFNIYFRYKNQMGQIQTLTLKYMYVDQMKRRMKQ